jgi:hypothetical protein
MHAMYRIVTRMLPAALLLAALAACGGGGGGGGAPTGEGPPPFITLTTQQDAAAVIGQPDFDSGSANQGGPVAANGFFFPQGNPKVVNGTLFVPDSFNNRVLAFSSVPTTNDPAADFVLGQSLVTASGSGNGAGQLNAPMGIGSFGNKLLVSDWGNNRVLIWNSSPAAIGAPADVVVGQSGFGSSSGSCTDTGLNNTQTSFAVNGKLLVADTPNHRVLIWNSIPTAHGAPADLVLGQDAFDECSPNDLNLNGIADDSGFPDAYTLYDPGAVWSDGTRVLVADATNNRVLIWNAFPTVSAAPADIVLGQSDSMSHTALTTQSGLKGPGNVTSNGIQIFVADANNNRVMVWNAFPDSDGAPADVVLGQPDFTSNASGTSVNTMNLPFGVQAAGTRLIVSDTLNNRVLIYQGQ